MTLPGWRKYGVGAGGMLVVVLAILLASGMGSAAAAAIINVFVTNDSNHPVPVHEQGTANVNVTGAVSVTPKPPTNAFSISGVGTGPASQPNLPAGSNWYITSFSVANDGDFFVDRNGFDLGCGGIIPGADLNIPAHDTRQLTFPQPFVMHQDADDECLEVLAGNSVHWTMVGYHD
jgi:hypothetical protein